MADIYSIFKASKEVLNIHITRCYILVIDKMRKRRSENYDLIGHFKYLVYMGFKQ